jgi:uncharacterized protein
MGMKYHRLDAGEANFVLVFEPDDDVVAEIVGFARKEKVTAARLAGIGGLSKATLGYFRRDKRRYEPIAITEQVELLSLLGNITRKDGEPLLHAHAVVARRGGKVRGGHLIEATVWPTLELFATVYPTALVKTDKPELGIATIDLDASRNAEAGDRTPGL